MWRKYEIRLKNCNYLKILFSFEIIYLGHSTRTKKPHTVHICQLPSNWVEPCGRDGPQTSRDSVIVLQLFQLFATPWATAHQASLSFTVSWSLLKLVSIESMMTFNHLILYCPLPRLPSIFTVSGSFPVSWLFLSGCQSTEASASSSASVLPMDIQD